jgi:Holliday junction resolvase-like predicted endonuclease
VGWTLLAANLRVGSDEADLVLRDEAGCPVIVEVKSSAGGPMGPELQVGPWKQARLRRLALRLAHSPQGRRLFGVDRGRETVVPRIDVVTVRLAATGPRDDRIERHLLNAVEGGPTPRRRGVLR